MTQPGPGTATALPPALLEAPAEGDDPFAEARSLLPRMAAGNDGEALPPFAGGLVGYLGYDLGRRFERLPSIARVDQHLPVMRLGLYDWAIAWDRRRGEAVLAARVVDGDTDRMGARIRDVLDRVDALGRGDVAAARADVRVRHDGGIDERIPAVEASLVRA